MGIKQRKKKIPELIIDEIRRMIQEGEIKDGDKLPNQVDFAAKIGVSRNSLREALNSLSLFGAIEQSPGTGTIVKASHPILLANQFEMPAVKERQSVLEYFQARLYVETGTVSLAVENAEPDELELLQEHMTSMEDAVRTNNTQRFYASDLEFHFQIAKASHNRFLINYMMVNYDFMKQLMQGYSRAFTTMSDFQTTTCQDHRKIYDALQNRDKKAAVKAITFHLKAAESNIHISPPQYVESVIGMGLGLDD